MYTKDLANKIAHASIDAELDSIIKKIDDAARKGLFELSHEPGRLHNETIKKLIQLGFQAWNNSTYYVVYWSDKIV